MSMTFEAIYESGALHPVVPVDLTEGELLDMTVRAKKAIEPSWISNMPEPTPEEAEFIRNVKATRSLDELLEIANTAPPLPEGYDLCKALNDNRRANGIMEFGRQTLGRLTQPRATDCSRSLLGRRCHSRCSSDLSE